MLDINFIIENKDLVKKAIENKKGKPVNLGKLIALNGKRKELQKKIDDTNRERNEAATKRDNEAGKKLKEEGQKTEEEFKKVHKEFMSMMLDIPNVPSPDTPIGDASANKILREWGEKPKFDFEPKPHWELGKALDVIDMETAAEVSGARFSYIKGDLVLAQFALINLCLSLLTDRKKLEDIAREASIDIPVTAFIPVLPPMMMKPAVMKRMARLDPIDDRYYFEKDDLVLVGSAEHTLGPLHMDETLDEKDLPLRYVGYSTAFRREAGSYGQDTRGILRAHQFDKMEMESFILPEHSYREQDFLVAIEEYIMRLLGLPFRVVLLSTGDMGGPDHRQIDIEVWMPGQNTYRETHSADLIGGYQSRRLNTKVKRTDGKTEHIHMNDATVLAMGRTLIAIMENNQLSDGSIKIPEVLRKYIGKEIIGFGH